MYLYLPNITDWESISFTYSKYYWNLQADHHYHLSLSYF
jgi:hypothetical protein